MPLSSKPAARARSLANLQPGAGAVGQEGNARAVTHGGYAQVARGRLSAKVLEVCDALAEDAPLREVDGSLPRQDAVVVELLAKALCRLQDVEADVTSHGVIQNRKTGTLRPAVEREQQLRREVLDYLEALGMTPRSRAKLGLDLQRGLDTAREMSALDREAAA